MALETAAPALDDPGMAARKGHLPFHIPETFSSDIRRTIILRGHGFDPQKLASESLFEVAHRVSREGEGARQRIGREVRDMLVDDVPDAQPIRSEEHTSELQSLMRI